MTQITNQLLISTPLLIGLIAVGVAALALFVYGWCVRFSRIGWSGAQVFAVFGGTLLLALIPNGGGLGGFFISVGGAVGVTVVVLLLGGLLRGFFRRRSRRAKFISDCLIIYSDRSWRCSTLQFRCLPWEARDSCSHIT